jgi:hypothetical protein
LEDALISFAIGATGWLVPLLLFRSRLDARAKPRVEWLLLLGLGPPALFLILWSLVGQPMTLLIAIQAIMWPVLVVMRPGLVGLSLANAIVFPVLYLALLRVYLTLWPAEIGRWSDASLWGRTILDVPLGELVWACGLGLGWPLAAGLIFDVKLVPRREPDGR